MAPNARTLDPTLISATMDSRSRRPFLATLCQTSFWLGIVAWWLVLALSLLALGPPDVSAHGSLPGRRRASWDPSMESEDPRGARTDWRWTRDLPGVLPGGGTEQGAGRASPDEGWAAAASGRRPG